MQLRHPNTMQWMCQWWYYKTRQPFLIYIFFSFFFDFPVLKSINFSSLFYTFSSCKNLKFRYLSHANQYPLVFCPWFPTHFSNWKTRLPSANLGFLFSYLFFYSASPISNFHYIKSMMQCDWCFNTCPCFIHNCSWCTMSCKSNFLKVLNAPPLTVTNNGLWLLVLHTHRHR